MATSRVALALQAIEREPGITKTPTEIAQEIGCDKGQASSALRNLADNPRSGVERISRGAYRYIGTEAKMRKLEQEKEQEKKAEHQRNSTLFELRGSLKDGRLILQDDEGEELYLAQKLSEVL